MFRKLLIALTLGSIATLASAQQETIYVIPAAGSGPGAGNSIWRTEVTFHNGSDETVALDVQLHSSTGPVGNNGILVRAHRTGSSVDIVKNALLLENVFGALIIKSNPADAAKLAITSRAVNDSPNGQFGQDIPALPITAAFTEGARVVINGPKFHLENRFNFGLYPVEDTVIDWIVYRKDGPVAAQKSATYEATKHVQYNDGIANFFGIAAEENDVIVAHVKSGKVFLYGSVINNQTGDPSYVPAIATRTNNAVRFLGVDVDENGTVDFPDANGDNTLDTPLVIYAGTFPNFFKLVAEDPEGSTLTYSLINASSDVRLLSGATIQWLPAQNLRGTTGSLTVRVSDGVDPIDFVIPVVFR
jgi:hypothetical protein